MDDVAEQQEIASEISDAISNPVGFGTEMDEVRSVTHAMLGLARIPLAMSESDHHYYVHVCMMERPLFVLTYDALLVSSRLSYG